MRFCKCAGHHQAAGRHRLCSGRMGPSMHHPRACQWVASLQHTVRLEQCHGRSQHSHERALPLTTWIGASEHVRSSLHTGNAHIILFHYVHVV